MKIVKYIFLLLLLASIAVTVFVATQDGRYDIYKEKVIKVPKAVIFNYLNDYRNWENIGILTDNDSTAVYTFPENTSGEGALTSWTLNDTKGTVRTLKLVATDSILQKVNINEQDADIAWGFTDTLNSTKVSVRMRGKLTFKEKAYTLLYGGVEEKMEASLNTGLNNLNTFLVHELNTFDIDIKGLVTKTGTYYLGHSAKTSIAGVGKKSNEMFPKLFSFVKTNNIAVNGAPFILYNSFNTAKDSASFVLCIPIKDEIIATSGSEFEGGKIEAFQALKTTLKGDYSHLKKAWDAANKHIGEKKLVENTSGKYIEVYTTGGRQTKKPSEWITDIYIPIGQPAAPDTYVPASGIQRKTQPAATPTQPPATNSVTTPRQPANTPPGTATE